MIDSGDMIPADVFFVVPGEAAPAGSKRAFRNPHSGRIQVTDASKRSKPWKAQVAATAMDHFRGALLDGPLIVEFSFYKPRPKGHYGQGRNSAILKPSAPAFPATRPDVLKLARGTEDSLTGIVWGDDVQAVRRPGPVRSTGVAGGRQSGDAARACRGGGGVSYRKSTGITVPLIRRMAVLRNAGLSYGAIAAVVEVDNPSVVLTKYSVYYHLRRYGPNVMSGRARFGLGHDPGNFARAEA